MNKTVQDQATHVEPAVRAEEIVDRAGERMGSLAATLSHQVLVLAARAREEAEDIWAEARSMRRVEK